jgi:hypothetical protein
MSFFGSYFGSYFGAAFGELADDSFIPVPLSLPPGSVDHVYAAYSRLPQQFKDKPNIVGLVTALVQPYQDLETALWDLFTKRTIYTAFGATLDAIGALVNQPRNGLGDADYQRFIAARVKANRSGGTPPNLIAICRLVVNNTAVTFVYSNIGIAAYEMFATGAPVTDAVAAYVVQFLQQATAGGVRGVFRYSDSTPSTTFRFPTAVAFTTGALAPAATSIPVNSTAGFADSGKLDLQYGTVAAEFNIQYTGRTAVAFTGVTGITASHGSNIAVQPALSIVGATAGMNTAAGGTSGGMFASALST